MFEKTVGFRLFFWITLIVLGFFIFFPLYWMVITGFKPKEEMFSLAVFPARGTLEHYWGVMTDIRILTYLKNSIIVAIASSFLATLVSMYAGYSFSKFRYWGRKSFMILILASKMAPHAVLLLSIYVMMKQMNLLDHYVSLIMAYIVFILPLGTWTLKAYFDKIPNALIESAKMDGGSTMLIIHRIIFPLAVPGTVSVAIYGFVYAWNDLLFSLTLVTSPEKRTLAPGLILTYMGEFQDNWSSMMSASVIVSIPVTIMFIFLQRFFISGLTSGSMKG